MGQEISINKSHAQQVSIIYYQCRKSWKNRTKNKSNKKSTLLIHQLLEMFHLNKKYQWAEDIIINFYEIFLTKFQSSWDYERQTFYNILLYHCGEKNVSQKSQKYFYEKIAKIELNQNEGDIIQKIQKDYGTQIEMMDLMNQSILKDGETESFPFIFKQSHKNKVPPLSELLDDKKGELSKVQKSEYNERHIQNSSVIVPETIFIDRLSEEGKSEVNEFVVFYKCFSNSIQQMVQSLTMFSCPIKTFEAVLRQKMKRKKIKKEINDFEKVSSSMRKKREYNNSLLLLEFRSFINAYTDFVWKFLQLYLIEETVYKDFITIETVQGIILKSIWNFTSWIGDRGCQWQQSLLPKIVQGWKVKEEIKIDEGIIEKGMSLSKQDNPQRYLKKIVIIYRQLGRTCENADELLLYLQKLLFTCISRGHYERLLKMENVINKIMTIPETSGQISYAWVSWTIILQIIKNMISQYKQH